MELQPCYGNAMFRFHFQHQDANNSPPTAGDAGANLTAPSAYMEAHLLSEIADDERLTTTEGTREQSPAGHLARPPLADKRGRSHSIHLPRTSFVCVMRPGRKVIDETETRPPSPAEEIEVLLAPIRAELQRLKNTKVPPYNPHIQSKNTGQILKNRLLPVGRHVLALLIGEPEERRGILEADICQYIAEIYWPKEVMKADGLRVMEMYRNAVFVEDVEWDRGGANEEVWRVENEEAIGVDDDVEEDVEGINAEAAVKGR